MSVIKEQFRLLSIVVFLLMFFSCNNSEKVYKIAISDPSTSLNKVGIPIIQLLEKEMNIKFEILDTTKGSVDHIKLLSDGKIDFAIALTTVKSEEFDDCFGFEHDHIRTITPLYNQNLFILYPNSIKPKNIRNLIRGRRIGFGIEKGGTAGFTQNILKEFGIEKDEYTAIYSSNKDNLCNDKIDVSCSFTSFNNYRIIEMLRDKNISLFSLGDTENANSGSAVDGICKKLWTAKPQIIPKNSYYDKPDKPVLTVSVFTSLLCNKNIDTELIRSITETIVKNKSTLIRQNPVINQISEENLHKALYFPLHEGVHLFLERNNPSFLERYAEVIALLLSVFILFSGVISSYRKWNKQRKKDRIDVYYEEVLEINRGISNIEETELLKQKIDMLNKIRERAFENLIKEKLIADESFKIFTELSYETILQIEKKIAKLNL